MTSYGEIKEEDYKLVLPLTLRYLCPSWLTFIGLGTVSAATMSSADSCILSAATMFSKNIYKELIRPHASDNELVWVVKIMILVVGITACGLSLVTDTIYGLSIICADLVYVVLFPQLFCVLYLDFANLQGSIGGYLVGTVLRLTGGDSILQIPALIPYPGCYVSDLGETIIQFPVKTFSMLASFCTIVVVSYFTSKWKRTSNVDELEDLKNNADATLELKQKDAADEKSEISS